MDKPSGSAGRSRGIRAGSGFSQGHPGARGRRPPQAGAGAPPVSSWGNPNVGSRGTPAVSVQPQPGTSTGSFQQRPQASAVIVRAVAHRNVPPMEGAKGQFVSKEDNRGAVRDKRVLTEMVQSWPKTLVTKCGFSGRNVVAQDNYCRVLKKPILSFHQYRVDFSPDVDMVRLRFAYLAHHKDIFSGYIFDGTVLFCTVYLSDKMVNGVLELLTKNREGETILIKLKHVGIVDVTDNFRLNPQRLLERLRNFFSRLQERESVEVFNSWNRVVDNALVEVPARLLPSEQILLHNYKYQVLHCNLLAKPYLENNNNVPAGTLRFFLVSQSRRPGKVSPTSYNVMLDTMGLPADKIQILTYKMTHLYYKWSGTLRVPAVCQYAHKLACLVAESIHRAPNAALDMQLYFL
ncbi:protein aubergine-like [Glossina fuscipes]|uniref:Protein aubergine-like n=1 Tax=Glossina fuscipes TaxID=7396 RepID=A0A8U0W860_9MUSC|nr:protein aubergine-like [Glossina fuscipes]